MTDRRTGALAGIRVLDLSWVLVGPFTSGHFADNGAEVIKVESTKRPDVIRTTTPFIGNVAGLDRSVYFACVETSRRSLSLNLRQPRGLAIARKLATEWADVVIQNWSPGTIKKVGLDYDTLSKINPRLVMASLSVMGQNGPLARFEGVGMNASAASGFYDATGWPDREPAAPSIAYSDITTPIVATAGILAALEYRDRTGRGQHLDIAMSDVVTHFMGAALLDNSANERVWRRQGNRLDRAAPHGAFACEGADRWCVICVFTDEEWQALCRAAGHAEWAADPRFATLAARKTNEQVLEALIEGWTSQHSAEDVTRLLQAAGVPSGVCQDVEDLMDRDPQLAHRGYFRQLDHPVIGSLDAYASYPYILPKSPADIRRAPCIGEDNEYVCTQLLGMSDEEFADLLAEGVLE